MPVKARSTSRERELALQRFYLLPTREQLAVYREIRDYLAARVVVTKRDRLVEERAGAVEALAAVQAHLKLDGRAPTVGEFDAAARELDLGWNRSRVARAWGRWRFATEALIQHDGPLPREPRLAQQGRRRDHATALEGVQWWLASKPDSLSTASYRAWAKRFNDALPDGASPVMTDPANIKRHLRIKWPDVIRVAAGEITIAEGAPLAKKRVRHFCRGPHALVGRADIVEILGRDTQRLTQELASTSFPTPVLVVHRNRVWMREDVEAYARGESFPERQRNELRPLYMTAREVEAASGIHRDSLELGRHGVPGPAVALGRIVMWLRTEIEEWLSSRLPPD